MNMNELLNSPEIARLGWTLVHSLWQGTAVAMILGLLLLAMRRRSPQARYAVAISALLLVAVAGAVTFTMVSPTPAPQHSAANGTLPPDTPAVTVPTASEHALAMADTRDSQTTSVSPAASAATSPALLSSTAASPADASPAQPPTPTASPTVIQSPSAVASATATGQLWRQRLRQWAEPCLPWLVAAWLVGVVLLALWRTGGYIAAMRLRVIGTRGVDDGTRRLCSKMAARLKLTQPVRVLQSALALTPMVIGHLRPVILLPVSAITGLTPAQVQAILAHELAHIRRHDYLVNLLQTLVETLLFYHPAVWWMSSRIRLEREHCCDDLAVAAIGDRRDYALALAALAEIALAQRAQAKVSLAGLAVKQAAPGAGMSLASRIRRVLALPEGSSWQWHGPAAGLLLLASVVIAAVFYGCHANVAPHTTAPAATPTTAPANTSQWRLSLANGATVELVSVSDCVSGKQWLPDGSPLADRSDCKDVKDNQPQNCHIALTFELKGISAGVSINGKYGSSSTMLGEDWDGGTLTLAIDVPRELKEFDQKVELHGGKWTVLHRSTGRFPTSATNMEGISILAGLAGQTPNGTEMTYSTNASYNAYDFNVVLIGLNGKPIPELKAVNGMTASMLSEGANFMTVCEFPVKLDEIKEFEFKYRPRYSLSLIDISLLPGHRTNAKFAIMPPAVSEPAPQPTISDSDYETKLENIVSGLMPNGWKLAHAMSSGPNGLHEIIWQRKDFVPSDWQAQVDGKTVGGEVRLWIVGKDYPIKHDSFVVRTSPSGSTPAVEIGTWRGRRVFLWGSGNDWPSAQADIETAMRMTAHTDAPPTQPAVEAVKGNPRMLRHGSTLTLLQEATDADLAMLQDGKGITSLHYAAKPATITPPRITDEGLATLEGWHDLRELIFTPSTIDYSWEVPHITDAALKHLAGLHNLQKLDLTWQKLTDAGMASLSGLTNLQELRLDLIPLTDAGISHLQPLTNLKVLRLYGAPITDAGAANLSNMTQMEELSLGRSLVTDKGLETVSRMKHLAALDLQHSLVTSDGMRQLAGLSQLRELNLDETAVGDGGIDALAGLPRLERLSLRQTKLTDAGLAKLAGMKSLKDLDIRQTATTEQGLAAFKKAQPNVQVIAGGLLPVSSFRPGDSPLGRQAEAQSDGKSLYRLVRLMEEKTPPDWRTDGTPSGDLSQLYWEPSYLPEIWLTFSPKHPALPYGQRGGINVWLLAKHNTTKKTEMHLRPSTPTEFAQWRGRTVLMWRNDSGESWKTFESDLRAALSATDSTTKPATQPTQ